MVQVRYTKWGGRAHWELPARYLGEDEHGVWLGAGAGTLMARPGVQVVAERRHVLLLPREGAWTGAFYERLPGDDGTEVEVYVDIATVPHWAEAPGSGDGGTVTMVDLDLDVVRRFDGAVHVDDEDEFAEHQVRYGYPADVVTLAEESARRLQDAVRGRVEPFGDVGRAWLARFAAAD